jgi:hypothetical protein
MKVRVLQQFLRNLIPPLEASAAPGQTIAGLQRACEGFDPFRDKDIADFAEFLTRAAAYERDGKWPSINPPIHGRILDEPSAQEYARRLRTFLEREVPSGSPIPDDVRAELNRLAKRLKAAQVKEMARELQVEDSFRGAKQGLEPRVKELVGQLTGPNLKALAASLGANRNARRKEGWNEIILSALRTPPGETREMSSSESKVTRLAEIIGALKAKADGPDAPFDEIDAELRSLEEQMDRDEAIAVAKRIGIVRHLDSRTEAVEEIRRKVFEMKRARESVAY